MRKIYSLILAVAALLCSMTMQAAGFEKEGGWFESAFVEMAATSTPLSAEISSNGGSTWIPLDKELIRKYIRDGRTYWRVDAVGLKAGSYVMKVNNTDGTSVISNSLDVRAHDRSGFAHVGMSEGIGAYKNDGTLKDGARVIYVTGNTAKTVKCSIKTSDKTETECVGLQSILAAFEKGKETRPLAIRLLGKIANTDMDALNSSEEGLQVKGKSGSVKMNITIEGIGDDAAIHGFGILARNAYSLELRNFAVLLCMDDCISLDTDNHNVWVHNLDLFYGKAGSDSDQAKGDGTVDIKGKSSHITVSYNHFYDSGKCSLGGMKSETTDCWMTYHHNWFDHSDSRHPRIRTAFYHVYNNYFDGNSKYGVGCTSGGSAFVENNYFRNCKYPMLISKQGTDAEGDGTFSGEDGGVIKSFNNVIVNPRKIQYYTDGQTNGKWDAVLVENRDASISATAYTGGTAYNNAADQAVRSQYVENNMDEAAKIPEIVRGWFGAGRMGHGDITWSFKNAVQDENDKVISALKTTVENYESTLTGVTPDITPASPRTPATTTVNSGDGKGIDQTLNDAYIPSWAGGSSEQDIPDVPGDDEYTLLINFPDGNAKGMTAKGTTTTTSTTMTLKNGYVGGSGDSRTIGNGIELKVDGGFKKGDIVTFNATIAVKSDDSKYADKIATTALLVVADGISETTSLVNTFGEVYNTTTKLGNQDDQTFILNTDYDSLWLVRSGGTSLNITKLIVKRENTTALDAIKENTASTAKVVKTLRNGRIMIGNYTISGQLVK